MEQSVFRINQAGYAAGLPVRAAVLGGGPVTLEDDKGNVIRTIADPQPRPDAASGDNAALLDLGVLPEGAYTLRRGGEQRGFSVSAKAFRAVGNALVKGLYYQRCGCALLPEHAGPYAHAACHTAPAQDWTDRSVRRSVTGGWHDAGDYGKYTGPGAVTAAHLMYAWKLFPDGCGDDLCIPETGNGVPDILNETKYELDWLQKMQRPDGSFHHKLTKDHFAAFIMPEEDREQEGSIGLLTADTRTGCWKVRAGPGHGWKNTGTISSRSGTRKASVPGPTATAATGTSASGPPASFSRRQGKRPSGLPLKRYSGKDCG